MKKHINKVIILLIVIIGGIGVYFGNKKLKDEKRWFYSTGTNEVVFGDITWGMSQQEVERVLGEKLFVDKDSSLDFINDRIIYYIPEIGRNDINPNNYTFNRSEELKLPKNIISKSKRLLGKPVDNLLGLNTKNLIFLFYNNKLFSLEVIIPIDMTTKEYEKSSIRKNFIFKSNTFSQNLFKDLHSKFGRLFIKNKFEDGFNKYQFINLEVNNVLVDGYLNNGVYDYEEKNLNIINYYMYCNVHLRYRPIIEEINKDIKETETSFFN